MDPQVAFQTAKEVLGEMNRLPLVERRAQALAELVEERLGQQGQSHLPEADVEIQGAGALPAEGLLETVKLLEVPTIGKVLGQGRHFPIS